MTNGDLNFQPEKFKAFVRYLIQVAKEKRCVPYNVLENIFGLSHAQVGYYAGRLGDYCLASELPLLNGLIINTTDCTPSQGFDWYRDEYGRSWEQIISECWRHFHVASSREDQVRDFAGRDSHIDDFLNQHLAGSAT